jgi:hypothetical protein
MVFTISSSLIEKPPALSPLEEKVARRRFLIFSRETLGLRKFSVPLLYLPMLKGERFFLEGWETTLLVVIGIPLAF